MASGEVATADEVASLVKRCLADGVEVEIERIGKFHPRDDGRFDFTAERRPSVFLAYAAEDAARVGELYEALAQAGLDPWMDTKKLLAGQNWPRAIERAIERADCFVACFSKRAANKRGWFQCEMRYALDCARRRPAEEVFLVPVRLEECEVPAAIRRELQYVDLFPSLAKGARSLVRAIRNAVAAGGAS
jgi:hypothetical protein